MLLSPGCLWKAYPDLDINPDNVYISCSSKEGKDLSTEKKKKFNVMTSLDISLVENGEEEK